MNNYIDNLRSAKETSEEFLHRVQQLDRKRPGTWRWWLKIVGWSMAGSAIGMLAALAMIKIVSFL